MPDTAKGRQAILNYIEINEIKIRSLGKAYGVSYQYVQKVLNGEAKGPSANKLILKIIDDFKI
ncbi:hypothetical protein [Pediococcus claussenii]|uniref:hypothetical protein n=1 Tax=Pediococcus claussenii TaxID=187452 RepID=UPI00081A7082|nr:hypothetical protein [Pediococcus claussenii]ANZ70340.1 hypothetical protein AYR57_08440 [Pediococcus claussenii]ANZ72156.1 hypothetical protein AYR58_08440 [Pediococcus claussenii]